MCEKGSMFGMTHSSCNKPFALDGLTVGFKYEGIMKKLITKFKYKLVKDLVDDVVELMVSLGDFRALERDEWIVIPVPLHKGRMKSRGFNQSEEIGKRVTSEFGWELNPKILVRTRYTTPQMSLSQLERIQNVKGAFSLVGESQKTKGKSLLILDDVWTTGSTMRECAKVLKRSGAKKVWGLAVAT